MEVIAHYRNYAHIRVMQCVNSLANTIQATSGNRRTPSNCQVAYNVINDTPTADQGGNAQFNLTAVPVTGNTSATLSNPWPLPTGSYGIRIASSAANARFVTLTNGATTCDWTAGGGALPVQTYFANFSIGYERYP